MTQTPTSDDFSLEPVRGMLYRLRNNSDVDVAVERVDNKDEFFRIDLKPDTTIQSRRSVDFIIGAANGKPVPGELVISLANADTTAVIPIPPKR